MVGRRFESPAVCWCMCLAMWHALCVLVLNIVRPSRAQEHQNLVATLHCNRAQAHLLLGVWVCVGGLVGWLGLACGSHGEQCTSLAGGATRRVWRVGQGRARERRCCALSVHFKEHERTYVTVLTGTKLQRPVCRPVHQRALPP